MCRWVCTICVCVTEVCFPTITWHAGRKNINASWIKTSVKVKPLNKEALVKRSERQCDASHQWSNRGLVDIIEAFISHTDLTRKLLIFQLFVWIAFLGAKWLTGCSALSLSTVTYAVTFRRRPQNTEQVAENIRWPRITSSWKHCIWFS